MDGTHLRVNAFVNAFVDAFVNGFRWHCIRVVEFGVNTRFAALALARMKFTRQQQVVLGAL